MIEYKDCMVTCDDELCNNDNSVFDLFQTDNSVESCNVCGYQLFDNGTFSGDETCVNSDFEAQKPCPIFASASCYTSFGHQRSVINGSSNEVRVSLSHLVNKF